MTNKVIKNLPFEPLFIFDPNLLKVNDRKKIEWEMIKYEKVCRLMLNKLSFEMTGKRKEFDLLKEKWWELYERAKIKQEKYEEAIKNAKKMPSLSATGPNMWFRRFQP